MKQRFSVSLRGVLLFAALGAALPAGPAWGQKVHELKASPATVHWGYFSARLPPVLTINSGDIVALDIVPLLEPRVYEEGRVPPSEISASHRAIYREVKEEGPHIMTGPIAVNGAEPGDVLEVRVLNVELAYSYAFNAQWPTVGALPEDFPREWMRVLRIDRQKKRVEVAPGMVVPLTHPFFGVMGVAPDPAAGRVSSFAPGLHGGNFDNKDLGAGSILYLPVRVRGGLFSAGDGHAAQGHGEVDFTAVETGLRGRLQFFVRKDLKLRFPRAETPTHWMVMGLHPDLNQAMKIAVRETIDFLVERFPRLTREEAYMIASVSVDYHVTQVVDQTKGVHGMIPKAVFAAR